MKNISACQSFMPQKIQPILYNALSTDLIGIIPNKTKFDVIFTELFDSSFFGERFLSVIVHAIESLLDQDGLIIPSKVTIKITVIFSNINLYQSFFFSFYIFRNGTI